jgi:hypothetical protein
MTRLVNVESAIVDRRKITGYLLNLRHPDGGPKAVFLMRFGFNLDNVDRLIAALMAHARSHDVAVEQPGEYGTRYIVDGPIETPDGRNPKLRAVWIVKTGEAAPRFVTAMPSKG